MENLHLIYIAIFKSSITDIPTPQPVDVVLDTMRYRRGEKIELIKKFFRTGNANCVKVQEK